jgi:putative PIN family toxin of toxin-antitoxin system
MHKVILDTNVIISAFLKAESNPALILALGLEGSLTVCLSETIWQEYQGVLRRKKFQGLDQESIEKLLSVLKQQALWVSPRISVNILSRDPTDNKFLECALESQADYLITGNTRHFPLKKFHDTRIINPRDFIDLIGMAISPR